MSGVTKKLMSAAGGGFTAIEDVFSTYLYTGNGSTQTITNDIDLAGEGGLTWIKGRSSDESHNLYDTERGAGEYLNSATNEGSTFVANGLTSFNSDGFSVGSNFLTSRSGVTYASWTFRKAPRFFDVVTYSGNGVAGREIAHSLGATVGSIFIKRTDNSIARDWAVYHRGNTAAPETDFLVLNLTNATADNATYWNATAPTDSVFTVGSNINVNASDGTYVAYLFAHDTESEGLIQCGSYTGNGSATGPIVDLGWEPQWLLIKRANANGNWNLIDNARGFTVSGTDAELNPNLSLAESFGTFVSPSSTGFQINTTDADYNASGSPFIYIAIRAEGV